METALPQGIPPNKRARKLSDDLYLLTDPYQQKGTAVVASSHTDLFSVSRGKVVLEGSDNVLRPLNDDLVSVLHGRLFGLFSVSQEKMVLPIKYDTIGIEGDYIVVDIFWRPRKIPIANLGKSASELSTTETLKVTVFEFEGKKYQLTANYDEGPIVLPDNTVLYIGSMIETFPPVLENITKSQKPSPGATPEETAKLLDGMVAIAAA